MTVVLVAVTIKFPVTVKFETNKLAKLEVFVLIMGPPTVSALMVVAPLTLRVPTLAVEKGCVMFDEFMFEI